MDNRPAPKRKLRRFPAPGKSGAAAASQPVSPSISWQEPGELPNLANETRVVLMVVSPYLVHVYWDLDAKSAPPAAPASLRFHDATEGQPSSSFDVPVNLDTKSWYVPLWGPARRYSVELGLNRPDGFVSLARSNSVETPRAWPVAEVRERFLRVGAADSAATVSAPPADFVQPPASAQTLPSVSRAAAVPSSGAEPNLPQPRPSPVSVTSPQAAGPAGPPTPSIPQPVDAAQVLRNRLLELYANRWWRGRPAGMPPPIEPASLVPSRPDTAADFTGRAETQFSPGLSSAQLGLKKPAG